MYEHLYMLLVYLIFMATWRNGSAFGFDRHSGTKRLQVRVLQWSLLYYTIILNISELVHFAPKSADTSRTSYAVRIRAVS